MKKNVCNILLFFLFVFPPLAYSFTVDKNILVITFFVFTIVFSSFVIFVTNGHSGSLLKIYFIFSYMFFGLIPLVEYDKNVVYWGGAQFSDSDYIIGSFAILIFNVLLVFFYRVFYSRFVFINGADHVIDLELADEFIPFSRKVLIMISSLICFFIILKTNNYSLISMLIRGGDLKETVEMERWLNSVLGTTFRFIPIFVLAYLIVNYKSNYLIKIMIGICAVFCASPIGISRFMVAALYLPVILLIFPSLLKGNKFAVILMSSLVFIFPFLENYRTFDPTVEHSFLPDYSFFLGGHFDSFQSFIRVIQVDYVTYGYQLIGVILFFIPRDLWSSKPIGSGAELADKLNYDFTNISANIFTEGYINFGFLGCILVIFILAYFFSMYDFKYWSVKLDDNVKHSDVSYFIKLGFLTFLLRGDLMSATAAFVALLIAQSLARIITTKKCI